MAQDWRDRAACVGLDTALFFPGRGDIKGLGVMICENCPVRCECLADALTLPVGDDLGVRGALTQNERKRLRRRRTVIDTPLPSG